MREIKFRGRLLNNSRWMIGNLVKYGGACYIIQENAEATAGERAFWFFEVHPETVGQFIGLLDKNGKEIYEGDIVKGRNIYKQVGELFHEFIGKVEFGNASFKISQDDCIKHYRWLYYECEVIGNVYENQGLMNEVENEV